jgi:site-specific recombinase XerD
MGESFKIGQIGLARYRVGPLGAYTEQYAARLQERQYAGSTAAGKLRVIGDLSRWLQRRHLGIENLDERVISKFLHHRRRYDQVRHGDAAAAGLLLGLLREQGVVPPPPGKQVDATGLIERDFELYLTQERRLSPATLHNTLPFVRRFLAERFDAGSVSLGEIRAPDVSGFVLRHAHTQSPARAKLMVGALRSFFRFLHLRGDITVNLALAVPTVADWRLSTLPKSIEPDQVERLLRSCDRRTAAGRRDHAVLLLLARLGLRAGEVASLSLDDIDWEAGEITVHGKGSRQDRLPLPQDVGEALAAYLCHGRPACASRRVFLTVRAPIHDITGHGVVGSIVWRSLGRAGIRSARKGAHLLRHSLAVRMLRQGGSLSEIGEILRHRLPDTTAIYAKVDLTALRALAPSWPGGEA